MKALNNRSLEVEQLEERAVPSATAIFSNGMLRVQGDDSGNDLMVSARADGSLKVTDHGAAVAITGTGASLANLRIVVERAGAGQHNTLATDASLGNVHTFLDATAGTDNVIRPGNSGPSTEIGGHGLNYLLSGPGPDVLIGGADRSSRNLFDWEPGTGTDQVIGRAGQNILLVVGNNNGKGENDRVDADGQGGFIYSRLNVVPFQIYATNIDQLIIRPSSGNDTVTIGDLTGVTRLKKIEVDGGAGDDTIDFSQQLNPKIKAVFNGGTGNNTYIAGAGPSYAIEGGGRDTAILPPDSGRYVRVPAKDAATYLLDLNPFLDILAT
jgi:hypothetical protein